MTAEIIPFNPLDKKNLGASVAEAMLSSPVHNLGALQEFRGAGIYAIYYNGKFPAYAPLATQNSNTNFSAPIYVGKAVPAGARKGLSTSGNLSKSLFKRLQEHAESINAVSNLEVNDFFCRFLVVDDIWIPLGESLLIARYSPVWNTLVDGFGNHDPGNGRYKGMRPRWDVLHPGREWALKCAERAETLSAISQDVSTYLRNVKYPKSISFIEVE